MSTESTTRKVDVQKLQRAIVNGLEDVKAQDIRVFNTEHLSPLFERVIVASGTSNRQTKALASSVSDAVKEAGFPKPRTEGEENGEWIIVDCGQAVVHVMQPTIRTYYNLEEIWGGKAVRMKPAAAPKAGFVQPAAAKAAPAKKKAASAKVAVAKVADAEPVAAKPATKKPAAKASAVKAAAGQTATTPKAAPKAPAAKKGVTNTSTAKPAAAKKVAAKPAAKATAAKKTTAKVQTVVVGAPAKKAPAKNAAAKKATATSSPRRKPAA